MAVDLFRDTKLRYLGYANEITTGVKHLAPHLVTPKVVKYSHQAVLAYIATDAAEKSMRRLTKDGNPIKMVLQAGDVLIWHGLASVVLPGVVLSKLRASLLQLLNTNPHATRAVPPKMRGLVTAGVGLLAIPIIVTPIDLSKDGSPIRALITTGDVLMWHGLASVILPGVALSKIRASCHELLNKNPLASRTVPPKMRGLVTAGVGLLAIPIIVMPIDLTVSIFMTMTYRLIFGR